MKSLETFLNSVYLFKPLTPLQSRSLLQASRVREYRKNQVLFWNGDVADRLLVVVHGWVKLYTIAETGEDAILRMATRGDCVGLSAIFGDPARHEVNGEVAERAEILEVPAAAFRQMAWSEPVLLRQVMETIRRKAQAQVEYNQIMRMSAPRRVGWLLLRLSAHMAGDGGSFPFPYDKSIAAAELGMSPETFSRALATLQRGGVNRRHSEIHIDDFTGLEEYCRAGKRVAAGPAVERQASL